MWKNYFKVALRSIINNKSNALIGIGGFFDWNGAKNNSELLLPALW